MLPNLLQCEWQEILQVSQKGQKKTQKFSFTWQNKWVGLLRKRHRWRQKKVKKINKKREKTRREEKHKEGQKDSKAYRAGGREGWFRFLVAKNPDCLNSTLAHMPESWYSILPFPGQMESNFCCGLFRCFSWYLSSPQTLWHGKQGNLKLHFCFTRYFSSVSPCNWCA